MRVALNLSSNSLQEISLIISLYFKYYVVFNIVFISCDNIVHISAVSEICDIIIKSSSQKINL